MGHAVTVLMTGAGAPGAPGIIRALGADAGIVLHVADANPAASGQRLCGSFHQVPVAEHPEFLPALESICAAAGIDLVLPLVTRELLPLAKRAAAFARRSTLVLVSQPEALEVALDKGSLYAHLAERGVVVPGFRNVDTPAALEHAVRELGYPRVPVVVRPRRSNGSRGVRVLDAGRDRLSVLFNEKPSSLFSNLEEILAVVSGRTIPPLVVSEYLPGGEITVDTLADDGAVIELLVRTRDAMRSGITVSGRFVREHRIERHVREIVSTLPGLHGPVGFQLKQAADGSYKLLECNPRLQGTTVAGLGCGVNMPLLAVRRALGLEVPSYTRKERIGFTRVYQELFYEY